MKKELSLETYLNESISEMKFDLDIDFCKENDVKFNNHEIDATTVELFTTECNKAAFQFAFKNK